jgi:hypothetical protein
MSKFFTEKYKQIFRERKIKDKIFAGTVGNFIVDFGGFSMCYYELFPSFSLGIPGCFKKAFHWVAFQSLVEAFKQIPLKAPINIKNSNRAESKRKMMKNMLFENN